MKPHEFVDMPGCSTELGDKPLETTMLLRCKWCLKTPTKAREDACPIHELEAIGYIRLDAFNPSAIERFMGRKCVTCNEEIMTHWLINSPNPELKGYYWCDKEGKQPSEGITDCVYDLNGVTVPEEQNNNRGD